MDRRNTNQTIYLIYEFLSEQGGLEREIINHARMLMEEGYKVKVLTCHLDKKIFDLLPFEGIDIETISKIKIKYESLNLALCFLGINNLSKYNPESFISYSFPCNFLIRRKKCKKINYVNHYPHFIYLSNQDRKEWAASTQGAKRKLAVILSYFFGSYLKRIDKSLLKKNKLIFMNSAFTQRRLEKLYNISNTIISYPPLDTKFKPSFKNDLINKEFIFSSSRIIPDKKYGWLIKSCSFMKHKLPLYLAGSVEESYKKILFTLAKKLKVEINFLGRLKTEKIINYYSSAAVFAFPTPEEDFGLVPAESLACGTPVVVWGDGAGPTEQIINGMNGFWAKPYDIKDFAKKLDLILNKQMKIKNKGKIIDSAKKFTYAEVKKGFIKEINKVL